MFKIISTIYYPKYTKIGIKMPEYINNATNEYFDDNDLIGAFLRKVLVLSNGNKVPVSELFKLYTKHCHNISTDSFGKSIKRLASLYPKKIVKYNSKTTICIINYKLNNEIITELEKEYNEKNNIVNTSDILNIDSDNE